MTLEAEEIATVNAQKHKETRSFLGIVGSICKVRNDKEMREIMQELKSRLR